MYEPVANFIQRRSETFIEEELLRATQEMELDVNREELSDSPFREYYMECSECGRKVEGISVEDAINYRKLCGEYPYCHCGARMDGGNEE